MNINQLIISWSIPEISYILLQNLVFRNKSSEQIKNPYKNDRFQIIQAIAAKNHTSECFLGQKPQQSCKRCSM